LAATIADPTYDKVLGFARELDVRHAAYTMAVSRPEAVMFTVSVPGEATGTSQTRRLWPTCGRSWSSAVAPKITGPN
jgi:hypothetical protein